MDTRLMQQIKDILKEFPQYWNGEELQRPIVIDDLKNYDALLISALLKNQKIRENYSIKAGDVVIFKVQEFIDILRYKDYWTDSYTKYSNTIGLSSEGKYLQYNTDVVLDFPYKDCILEGGMTKEDTGKEEVFYNEVIARDEIDTLLAPKAFVNVKKYDADGEHTVDSFSDEDNLIIKGNNLLALYSLKERYVGKVKCIYIDPPYNTGGDSFKYNDRFNHSTWLTFMKNRLLIAKELLLDDGILFISLDDKEAHYCKVLSDEIFGRENFIADIAHKSRASVSNDKIISTSHNHLLMYAKKERSVFANKKEYGVANDLTGFKEQDNKGVFKFVPVDGPGGAKKGNPFFEFLGVEGYWRFSKETMEKMYSEGRIVKKGKTLSQKYYLEDAKNKRKTITTWWDENFLTSSATSELTKLFENKVFDNPKNENLLKRVLEFTTKENDIVLDFFMGSATTQAVAMKMNRRFIGIEQMDYINTVSVPRLKKVIEGEQGGISKDVNWQGGSSFIYVELMELNQLYMNKIDQISTKEELSNLWNELDNNADLNFQLDKEKLTNELLKEHDEEEGSITFNDLTFDEQKEIFKRALDKNQLYVPYSEIEDKNVIISDNDKAFNHSFYSNEGE
ncbi:site-specific DNA-methyltransferase [Enterococcus faecalis]|uniref:site-specific DNA-methyltransferase n=1 Tax=Enterococcus faecalis TaxID=1351 RepID=UPI000FFEF8C5|nr:site-specific DNA-methyltransferase [Enterococcus faecalis]RXF30326.1 site-specific DNA-methyltransferase [Enterococcus faecalis]